MPTCILLPHLSSYCSNRALTYKLTVHTKITSYLLITIEALCDIKVGSVLELPGLLNIPYNHSR